MNFLSILILQLRSLVLFLFPVSGTWPQSPNLCLSKKKKKRTLQTSKMTVPFLTFPSFVNYWSLWAALLEERIAFNNLKEEFQSGFKANHSNETSQVRVINDLLVSADWAIPYLFFWHFFFLSQCFVTQLHQLEKWTGLTAAVNLVIYWFKSHILDNFLTLLLFLSCLSHGVPQGPVLSPLIIIMYMLGSITRQQNLL